MPSDRPLAGIALMLLFCLLAPLSDALAKALSESLAIGVLVLARFATQFALMAPIALATFGWPRVSRSAFLLILARATLHTTGIFLIIASLRFLPLAEAIAIAYVMPFLLLLFGWLLLDEPVGKRRILACIAGFGGTLMVVQPTFALFGWPALLPLAVAVVFALFMLLTRRLSRDIDPVSLQALNGSLVCAVLGPVLVAIHAIGLADISPPPLADRQGWTLLVAMGLTGSLAHLALNWALRLAPSTVLAPVQYLEIPFAVAFGWLMFRDLPNGLAAAGIAVIASAGVAVVLFERLRARAR